MKTGRIEVTEGHIRIEYGDESCQMRMDGPQEVTVEAILDAVRILCGWMDVSYEDVSRECQRVHYNDQLEAALKEMIEEELGDLEEED